MFQGANVSDWKSLRLKRSIGWRKTEKGWVNGAERRYSRDISETAAVSLVTSHVKWHYRCIRTYTYSVYVVCAVGACVRNGNRSWIACSCWDQKHVVGLSLKSECLTKSACFVLLFFFPHPFPFSGGACFSLLFTRITRMFAQGQLSTLFAWARVELRKLIQQFRS